MPLETRPLTPDTWPAFAALIDRSGGVWGGCWCMGFHINVNARGQTAALHKAAKRARVEAGTTHAALVFDGADCVGWCQYGPTDSLPRIKHARAYRAGLPEPPDPPDWRITCFFVDKTRRKAGIAAAALAGALVQIAGAGGGIVESYPEDVSGRKTSGSFLYNATLSLFEAQGFARQRPLGSHHWVVRRTVAAAAA